LVELKKEISDFLGLSISEFDSLFPKFNELDIKPFNGVEPISCQQISDIINISLCREEDNFDSESSAEELVVKSDFLELSKLGRCPCIDDLPLNILLKGVPGTGKSYLIDRIVESVLEIEVTSNNVKRINIHSASDNSSLMQGIGIALVGDKISYLEKQGGILSHLIDAIKHPNQPYVLILEEIQENSLNELIGDLIYLIEPEKRVNVGDYIEYKELFGSLESDIDSIEWLSNQPGVHSVRLPS
ncbi:TPA: AAA family ATPase, partial [Vibrio antiquarius]